MTCFKALLIICLSNFQNTEQNALLSDIYKQPDKPNYDFLNTNYDFSNTISRLNYDFLNTILKYLRLLFL